MGTGVLDTIRNAHVYVKYANGVRHCLNRFSALQSRLPDGDWFRIGCRQKVREAPPTSTALLSARSADPDSEDSWNYSSSLLSEALPTATTLDIKRLLASRTTVSTRGVRAPRSSSPISVLRRCPWRPALDQRGDDHAAAARVTALDHPAVADLPCGEDRHAAAQLLDLLATRRDSDQAAREWGAGRAHADSSRLRISSSTSAPRVEDELVAAAADLVCLAGIALVRRLDQGALGFAAQSVDDRRQLARRDRQRTAMRSSVHQPMSSSRRKSSANSLASRLHVAPGVAPAAISHCLSDPRKAGLPLHKQDHRTRPTGFEPVTFGFVDRRAPACHSRLRRLCDRYATCPVRSFRPKVVEGSGIIPTVNAKETLLQQAPQWNDAQATAALRVVEAHDELASYLDAAGSVGR